MTLTDTNTNPLALRWRERYSKQTLEVQNRLDVLHDMDGREYQLKVINRSSQELLAGDIFVLSPRKDLYFYGGVIETNIEHLSNDTFINGKNLIFIFKNRSCKIDITKFELNYGNLLIEPAIVDFSYWKRGYFFTIGHEEIIASEKKLDYGFYSIGKNKYLKANGLEMDHRPTILGTYGISTITGIAYEIEKELIIDPTLLETYC